MRRPARVGASGYRSDVWQRMYGDPALRTERGEFPTGAGIRKFYRPPKQSVKIRLDADAIDWLKGPGPDYQARVNDYLRDAINRIRRRR